MTYARMGWAPAPTPSCGVHRLGSTSGRAERRLRQPEHDADQRPPESVLGEAGDAAARRPRVGFYGRC